MLNKIGAWLDCVIPIVICAVCLIGGMAVALGFVQ